MSKKHKQNKFVYLSARTFQRSASAKTMHRAFSHSKLKPFMGEKQNDSYSKNIEKHFFIFDLHYTNVSSWRGSKYRHKPSVLFAKLLHTPKTNSAGQDSLNGYYLSETNNDYDQSQEYDPCCDSDSSYWDNTKTALIIGAAAIGGGAIGAAISGNKKGHHGSDGHTGAPGEQGDPGADGTSFAVTTGPEQLTFTFHTAAQTSATGLLRGVVTLPDLSFQTVELPFDTIDNVGVITIGPPAEEGDYTLTIHIHTLTGSLTSAPSVIVGNSLNSEQSSYTAALPQSQGQQSNFLFVYDTFLLP